MRRGTRRSHGVGLFAAALVLAAADGDLDGQRRRGSDPARGDRKRCVHQRRDLHQRRLRRRHAAELPALPDPLAARRLRDRAAHRVQGADPAGQVDPAAEGQDAGSGDQVIFKWNKGEATQTMDFGDPLNTDDYALCVFDSGGGLLLQSDAPAGGVCGTKPCWKALGIKGFGYKDPLHTPTGADEVLLKAGLAGKAKSQFKAKGDNIPTFSLPLSLPVTAQIQSENGRCWAATFSAAGTSKNDTAQFKGKSD
jgi:hypothetical protein